MGKKILLAEDSLTIQKVFELTFRQSDIALTMVDNGIDAVRLAGEIVPDLVVADVSLPGKDGFDVAADLRNAEKTRSCPVLVLSGTLAPFDEGKFKSCGAAGVLFKPFDSQELIDKVEDLLSGHGLPSSAGEAESDRRQADEPWDFSDVIEEVEEETAASAPAVLHRGEDLLPGASIPSVKGEGAMSLGEFDISMEDIAPRTPPESAPAGEAEGAASPEDAPMAAAGEADAGAGHIEPEYYEDSPQAITDLTAALEGIEEVEELEAMEELKEMEAMAPPVRPPEPPPAPEAGAAASVQETPGDDMSGTPPELSGVVPAGPVSEAEPRDEFSARAREILGSIAAETMEKVMWEAMDRLTAEFSEKIREAVEKVAWEVIPATAETLIREEISRIRRQAETKSP